MRQRRPALWCLRLGRALPVAIAVLGLTTGLRAVEPDTSGAAMIGVTGQVARPGVYAHPQRATSLAEVLDRCGGLAGRASGSIRVVRDGGRGVYQAYVSPDRPSPAFGRNLDVQPGDVIVVEETIVRSENPSPSMSETANFVQIAMLGIADRPAVEKIPTDYATLRGLVALLGQDPEVARSVAVIPGLAPAASEGQPTLDAPLPSGTVLVFDPASLEFDRIPPLTRPYDDRAPQPLIAAASPSVRTADHTLVLPKNYADRRDFAEPANSTARVPQVELLDPPPYEPEHPLSVVRNWPVPAPADVPPVEASDVSPWNPSIASATQDGTAGTFLGRFADAGVNGGTVADSRAPYLSHESGVLDDMAAIEAEQPAESGSGSLIALCVLSALAVIAAGGVARAIKHRRPVRSKRARPTRTMLDSLIYNELPVNEQDAALPQAPRFFGRPSIPATAARVDAEHGIPAPHFQSPLPAGVRGPSVRVDAAHSSGPPAPRSARRTVRPRPTAASISSRTGLLDRVLTSVQGDQTE